jgi:hypothetical protein
MSKMNVSSSAKSFDLISLSWIPAGRSDRFTLMILQETIKAGFQLPVIWAMVSKA